ncbi:MAG: HAD family hydrolase [Parvibaculaceae bacterium]
MSSGVDSVVFDIGNVLVGWDPRHLYRKVFASEAEMERFLSEICTLDWHLAHDFGVSFEENGAKLKALHPAQSELIDFWHTRYAEMIPGRVEGTVDLLYALKNKGLRVHGLTNMPVPVFEFLCVDYPELREFEEVVVSGAEGLVKPDAAIFELMISRAQLVPSRSLFIDDSLPNIKTAETLGFLTHHFSNSATLARDLGRLGLLP